MDLHPYNTKRHDIDANQTKNLNLILQYKIVELSLYSIKNIDLSVPCYFASIEKMINYYPINKIHNQKNNCLFYICMLKLDENHINAIHVQMMNQ
jgi:hypothetical protein